VNRGLRDDDAIGIGVEPGAWAKRHAGKLQEAIGLTSVHPLLALAWVWGEGLDAEVAPRELIAIADTSEDDDPRPPALLCELAEQPAHEGTSKRTAAIDDEHAARTRSLERFPNGRVVLEDLQRCDRAMEGPAAAEVVEDRVADLHYGVRVAKVGILPPTAYRPRHRYAALPARPGHAGAIFVG